MTKYRIKLNGKVYEMEVELIGGDGAAQPVKAAAPVPSAPVRETPAPQKAASAPSAATGKAGAVTSPLQGTIIKINAANGDAVKAGQTVIVLEAMKMQNNIESEYAGTVTAINVNPGDSVMEGAVMLTIG